MAVFLTGKLEKRPYLARREKNGYTRRESVEKNERKNTKSLIVTITHDKTRNGSRVADKKKGGFSGISGADRDPPAP